MLGLRVLMLSIQLACFDCFVFACLLIEKTLYKCYLEKAIKIKADAPNTRTKGIVKSIIVKNKKGVDASNI